MSHCFEEEVGSWRTSIRRIPSHECFPKSQHQQVVSVPELRYPVDTILVLVEVGKVVHEILFVEEVENLPAMKFGSIHEVDGIVGCRQ